MNGLAFMRKSRFSITRVITNLTIFSLFAFSPDRNNPVQGVWRQEQRCSLWRDHLRGLQRLLQAVPVVGRQLSMSAEQELRGRPCKQKPVPVLSVAKVPTPRHV